MKNKTKGKSPAFQFYASDFYMDTISWSDEMVGLHIRLLCQQWINDFIECDESGIPLNLSEKQKVVFDKIKHKYFVEKNQVLKNKKLDKIKKEKKEFIKKASKSGTDGALARWGKDRVPHENPNGVNMALQPSSSTSIISIAAAAININTVFEYLRQATNREFITNEQITQEANDFIQKYNGMKIINLRALCNTWADNMKPWQKHDKKISSFV